MERKVSFVHTKNESCMGCNKCIFVCPTNANEAFFEAEINKVFVKPGHCVSCGKCIQICDHGARDFEDDTERFFEDLKNGKQFSVVIAPSARFNFASVKKLTGYLRSLGVNKVYDVSFGADICTWGHVKAIKEQNLTGVIAQPCPVVVSYIEKYKPELKERLSPIHSPVTCLAIYLKKYLGIEDNIMFLSPCIGKKRESTIMQAEGLLEYNSTFIKFLKYLEREKISLDDYPQSDFDITDTSLGFTFSRPGGLSENIRYHLDKDIWIKQIEGIKSIKEYLEAFSRDITQGNAVPDIVDALNCKQGCNLGTGTDQKASINEIDYVLNANKATLSKENSDRLMKYFDEKLNIKDFTRIYVDRSCDYAKRRDVDIESAFISLGKFTESDRQVNCFSCGYGNCYDFAYELANGHNNKNNCKFYLLNKFKKMSHYDELTGLNNRNCFNDVIRALSAQHPGFIGIVYIDINGLKQANDTYGHSHGDMLIIACATILKKTFGNDVYRMGGDEFIVLCCSADEKEFIDGVNRLYMQLSKEEELVVSVGVSISLSNNDLSDKMDEADQEMYKAKQEYYSRIAQADRRKGRFSFWKD